MRSASLSFLLLLLLTFVLVACGPTRRSPTVDDDDDDDSASDDDDATDDDDDTDDDDASDDDDSTPPPGAPSTPGIAIDPTDPGVEDDLVLSITEESVDPDGDDVAYVIRWTLNGAPLSKWDDQLVITANFTNPDDEWEASVVATDGENDSDAAVAAVTVLNAAPQVDTLLVLGAPAFTDSVLEVEWSVSDADDAVLETTSEWHVNGAPTGETGDVLDGTVWFDKDDEVTFVVTVADPWHSEVVEESAPVVVQNTPPEAPSVSIAPDDPAEDDDELLCVVDTPSFDADGDSVIYTMTWDADSSTYASGTTDWPGDTVPGGDFYEDQVWTCTAEPSDGNDFGATAYSAPVTIDAPLPDLIISTPTTLTGGTYTYDDVVIQAGVLLTIEGDVTFFADTFTVEAAGTISGNGEGYAGGATSSSGSGPGGGGSSSNAGAGGGGHGGNGGNSGYDSGDNVGAGGSPHGSETTVDITIGSGGGGSTSAVGGAGGGALEVHAGTIVVSGFIYMDGNDAEQLSTCGADNRCAGGGAGGGIVLIGGLYNVNGGAGGPNGGVSAETGDAGTIHTAFAPF